MIPIDNIEQSFETGPGQSSLMILVVGVVQAVAP